MADIENDFGDDEDENFDKPNTKSQLKRGREKEESDEFGENREEDELEDLEVEIAEDDEPKGDKKLNNRNRDKLRDEPEDDRLGRRRQKFKPRESRIQRDLETQLNNERQRGDKLEEQLQVVASNVNQINNSNIDSQISEAQRYLDTAKKAHAAAVKDGDGDAAAEALDVMMEAKETLTLLNQSKKAPRRETETEDKTVNANNRRELPKPDPKVLRMFDKWHENNDWYDPALRDKHSRIAFHIDNALNAEGYDPRTPEYWDEFSIRCKENPTLAKEVFDADEYEEEEPRKMSNSSKRESAPAKRSAPLNERSNPTQSSKKIVVSRQRADAMREMGLQPGTTEWKKMAKKYEAYDKQRSA